MLENFAINRVVEFVESEEFYRAMIELSELGEPIDLITLSNLLKSRNELEEVGGATYLSLLVDSIPTAANSATYAKIIRENSILRRLIHGATEIVTRGYEANDDVEDFLDHSEKIIFDIAQKRIKQAFYPMKEIVKQGFKTIEMMSENKEMVTGVSTGFMDLDRMTSGLQPSDLIIVAGRPSMGKTAFALCIAAHAAMK